VGGITVGCLYLPNGNPAPGPKFDSKLAWFERLHKHAGSSSPPDVPFIMAGDYNVMPTDLDVYAPERCAGWFDNAMSRLSGTYKRWIKLISFFIALLVAGLLNADPIHLADVLWERQPVAAQLAKIPVPVAKDGTPAGTEAQAILKEIEAVGPLLGWNGFESDPRWQEPSKFALMLLGWIIAAGAALFGAPFWFDVLQRFVQLRGTGRPPRESAPAIPTALPGSAAPATAPAVAPAASS
jgi:hypothetical protein